MSYHPNGALSALTYGNGQVFSQTLTARQLPLRLRSAKGSTVALDLTYGYDTRGKVTAITDAVDAANSRAYGYDALGRLTSASGPWGAGSYSYDALSNLRSKTLGVRTVSNSYDASNRLTASNDSAGGNRIVQYDGRGNVTTLGGLSFVYDMSDQPVSVAGSANGVYIYDGNKKRVKAVVGGKTLSTSMTTPER